MPPVLPVTRRGLRLAPDFFFLCRVGVEPDDICRAPRDGRWKVLTRFPSPRPVVIVAALHKSACGFPSRPSEAHLKLRLSEAESGVLPILRDKYQANPNQVGTSWETFHKTQHNLKNKMEGGGGVPLPSLIKKLCDFEEMTRNVNGKRVVSAALKSVTHLAPTSAL